MEQLLESLWPAAMASAAAESALHTPPPPPPPPPLRPPQPPQPPQPLPPPTQQPKQPLQPLTRPTAPPERPAAVPQIGELEASPSAVLEPAPEPEPEPAHEPTLMGVLPTSMVPTNDADDADDAEAAEASRQEAEECSERAEKKAAKAAKAAKRALLNGDADAHELKVEAERLAKVARGAVKAAAAAAAAAAATAEAQARDATMRRYSELGYSKWEAIELENRARAWQQEAARHPPKRTRQHARPIAEGFETAGTEASPAEAAGGQDDQVAHERPIQATRNEVLQLMEAMSLSEADAITKLNAAEGDVNRAIDMCLGVGVTSRHPT